METVQQALQRVGGISLQEVESRDDLPVSRHLDLEVQRVARGGDERREERHDFPPNRVQRVGVGHEREDVNEDAEEFGERAQTREGTLHVMAGNHDHLQVLHVEHALQLLLEARSEALELTGQQLHAARKISRQVVKVAQ